MVRIVSTKNALLLESPQRSTVVGIDGNQFVDTFGKQLALRFETTRLAKYFGKCESAGSA